jgi:ribokinase
MVGAGRVVVIGSYNRDISLRVARFPNPGETLLGAEYLESHGGKGSNQAVQAARCGAAVTMIAALGDDPNGAAARALWAAEGIDSHAVVVRQGHATGAAIILVDAAGQNAIAVASGANATLSVEEIGRAAPIIAAADLVLVQLETPIEATMRAFAIAREAGVATFLNAAPAEASLPEALWSATDVVIANEIESRALTNSAESADPQALGAGLLDRVGRAAVITMGAAGAWLFERATAPIAWPTLDVAVVDSTGAGDAFTGAFAARWAETRDLHSAMAWGIAAGALACLRRGVVPALHHRQEIARHAGDDPTLSAS